jgi:type II secretory pathway pseudopilin PulG
MELLVVVGIIAIMTAMALPAVNKFLKGQKLMQAGRLIQSAFSEARRASITQRARHYLFFCHKDGVAGPDNYSIFSYREGKGWETTEIQLPSGVVPVFDTDPGPWTINSHMGCGLKCLDITKNMVLATDSQYFIPGTLTPSASMPVFEFRKDGTILPKGGCNDIAPPSSGPDIYDLNVTIDYVAQGTLADIVLRQVGDSSKRCFLDVDINTGRVRFRVAETDPNYASGQTQGG